MMWAPVVFWVLLVPLLVVLFVVYLKSRTLFRLLYILAVFTYAMTVMYTIDAYDLGRDAIIGILLFSAVLMMLVGWWFRKLGSHARKGGRKR
jgi:hypothetical protein